MATPVAWAAGLHFTPPLQAQFMPRSYSLSITPAAVTAGTVAEQTFTLEGATTKDNVVVSPPDHTANLALCAARVTAANTIAISWSNSTGGNLTPPSGDYLVTLHRCKQ